MSQRPHNYSLSLAWDSYFGLLWLLAPIVPTPNTSFYFPPVHPFLYFSSSNYKAQTDCVAPKRNDDFNTQACLPPPTSNWCCSLPQFKHDLKWCRNEKKESTVFDREAKQDTNISFLPGLYLPGEPLADKPPSPSVWKANTQDQTLQPLFPLRALPPLGTQLQLPLPEQLKDPLPQPPPAVLLCPAWVESHDPEAVCWLVGPSCGCLEGAQWLSLPPRPLWSSGSQWCHDSCLHWTNPISIRASARPRPDYAHNHSADLPRGARDASGEYWLAEELDRSQWLAWWFHVQTCSFNKAMHIQYSTLDQALRICQTQW